MQNKNFSSPSVFDATSLSSRAFSSWLGWGKFPEGASQVIHPPLLSHPSRDSFIDSIIINTISWGAVALEGGIAGTLGECIATESLGCAVDVGWWMLITSNLYLLSFLLKPSESQKSISRKCLHTLMMKIHVTFLILSITAAVAVLVSLRHPSQKAQSALIG